MLSDRSVRDSFVSRVLVFLRTREDGTIFQITVCVNISLDLGKSGQVNCWDRGRLARIVLYGLGYFEPPYLIRFRASRSLAGGTPAVPAIHWTVCYAACLSARRARESKRDLPVILMQD